MANEQNTAGAYALAYLRHLLYRFSRRYRAARMIERIRLAERSR